MQRLRNGEISPAEKKSEKRVTHDMPMRSYGTHSKRGRERGGFRGKNFEASA